MAPAGTSRGPFRAPHRRLVRRPAGDDAPVGGDATGAVERRRAAVIRPAGLPRLHNDHGHSALLPGHSKSRIPTAY